MPSPIEQFFESVFGHLPPKEGVAYEQLAAIALHVLNAGDVQHDSRLRGEFSKTIYQIDALHEAKGKTTMAEAKDYSARSGKVGRGDLQKLGGALPDLSGVNTGAFFSATGYTGPAKKYAAAAEHISGKPIELFELRPSVIEDEKGFIQTIVLQIRLLIPKLDTAKWEPEFTKQGNEALAAMGVSGGTPTAHEVHLSEFFDADGNQTLTMRELTSKGYADPDLSSGIAVGEFLLSGHFIKMGTTLLAIDRLKYEMLYEEEIQTITISGGTMAMLTLADASGKVLSLVNEHKLKQYQFDSQGNLIPPP